MHLSSGLPARGFSRASRRGFLTVRRSLFSLEAHYNFRGCYNRRYYPVPSSGSTHTMPSMTLPKPSPGSPAPPAPRTAAAAWCAAAPDALADWFRHPRTLGAAPKVRVLPVPALRNWAGRKLLRSLSLQCSLTDWRALRDKRSQVFSPSSAPESMRAISVAGRRLHGDCGRARALRARALPGMFLRQFLTNPVYSDRF